MKPDWYLPVVYQASRLVKGPKRDELVKLAVELARGDLERNWIASYVSGENLAKVGLAMRKASSVLNAARVDLEKSHAEVAD
jgi:hypothetical protein